MAWKMLILGILQGLAEFLPISSSGHLVLAEHLLELEEAGLAGVVFLHFGTLVALIVFFAKRIWSIISGAFSRERDKRVDNWRFILFIVLGSIPAALVGLLARKPIEAIFAEPLYVPFFLLGTGILLLLTRWGRDRNRSFGISDVLLVGLAQAAAVLPGLSRSGLTIATALLLGIASVEAFEFSFLLSIPAVLAANLLEFFGLIKEIKELSRLYPQAGTIELFGMAGLPSPWALAIGVAASMVVGFLALWALRRLVISRKFWLFSFYCFALGAASLILLLVLG
jgi:undecaprenyl-diphosphatase